MNRCLQTMLAALVGFSFVSTCFAFDRMFTEKTHMTRRSQGVNLPLEMTTMYHKYNKERCLAPNGFHLSVTGFYEQIKNQGKLSRYHGIAGSRSIRPTALGSLTNETVTIPTAANGGIITNTFDFFDVSHIPGIPPAIGELLLGDLMASINTMHRSWGAFVQYYQNLDELFSGLFLRVNMPIVHAESASGFTPVGSDPTAVAGLNAFLSGNAYGQGIPGGAMANQSEGLVDGAQGVTGVADIDISLDYNFLDCDWYHVSLGFGLTIPTGSEVTGHYHVGPLVGNGRHLGLGFDVDAAVCLLESDCHNLWFYAALRYRYLLEGRERRNCGITDFTCCGDVVAMAQAGTNLAVTATKPLTLHLNVTPGSQIDSAINLCYNYSDFSIDLGYNFYFKEKEAISLKQQMPTGNEAWYIAGRAWNTNDPFDPEVDVQTINGIADGPVTSERVSFIPCTTPRQFVHGIFAGIGYTFRLCGTHFVAGIGGKCDLGSYKNSAPEFWSIWGKFGVAF